MSMCYYRIPAMVKAINLSAQLSPFAGAKLCSGAPPLKRQDVYGLLAAKSLCDLRSKLLGRIHLELRGIEFPRHTTEHVEADVPRELRSSILLMLGYLAQSGCAQNLRGLSCGNMERFGSHIKVNKFVMKLYRS